MGQGDEAVAIVGVGCRLPGGLTDLAGLWDVLSRGEDMIGEMPEDRMQRARVVDPGPTRANRSYTAAGGFLPDVAGFDAGYFGIAPAEAIRMDPQQRLLLEMAVEALDDAGLPAQALAGSSASVFVGVSEASYLRLQAQATAELSPYVVSGGTLSVIANRLSYCLDLRGPSMVVDTACSSALVALDRACRSLLDGSSRLAFAGGVHVLSGPEGFYGFSAASMLSRRGRCAAFSADADGFVRAEGGGVVVLKRLADAVADGDRIHAVIAGSGTNSDGRTMGLALPNSQAQEALLRDVYERAGVVPDDLVYFEAHGTGTPAGDPAEARSVGRALGQRRTTGPLPIGSVKSNLGHLEPASGMAGLFKALLVLRHGTAPATLHALPLNPQIDFGGLGLAPTVEPVKLPLRPGAAVGINSFGFGGANAHVVLTAPPTPPLAGPTPTGRLPVLISARSANALRELATRMSARLREAAPDEFYDLAHTSTRRRSAHPHRAAVLADSPDRAADELDALFTGTPAAGASGSAAERGAVVYAFTGNGSQWPGMAADLPAAEPAFRAAVEEADAALAPHLGWSVAGELAHPDPARFSRTEVAQPALFAVQVGLAALLRANGVRPAAVLGHSVGEVAAAYVAGALTLAQAAHVIAERSSAQAATAGTGRMAAVGLPEQAARDVLAPYDGALELAAVNSDRDVTVAGDPRALAALGAELSARDVFFRELDLDHAFHSRAMDPLAGPLRTALAGLTPSAARIPFVSTVTGAPLPGEQLTADYWWRNVREPVRFAEAAAHALGGTPGVVVEIGPHPVLRPYLRRTGAAHVPTLQRDSTGPRDMAAAVTAVISAGAELDWATHFPHPARVADLPSYPWQRRRYWYGEACDWERTSGTGRTEHPLLGERLPGPHPTWENTVEPQLVSWLGDHHVDGAVVMPAAGYVEMALAAGRRALHSPVEVRHLEITRPLPLSWPDPGDTRVQTSVQPDSGALAISTSERRGEECHPVARAQVRTLLGRPPARVDLGAARRRCPDPVDGAAHYEACRRAGLAYGPAFQLLRNLHVGDGEVLAMYTYDDPDAAYEVWPAVLDAAFQAGAPLLRNRIATGDSYLPCGLGSVRVWRAPGSSGVIRVRQGVVIDPEVCWDIVITDEDGTVVVEIDRLRMRRMPGGRTPLCVQQTVLRAAPGPGDHGDAAAVPVPADLVEAARGRIAQLRQAWQESGCDHFAADADRTIAHHWATALSGLLGEPARPFTTGDLVEAGMLHRHRRLLKVMLPLLEQQGLVSGLPDGRWELTGTPRRDAELSAALINDHPAFAADASLLTRQLHHLPGLLTGGTGPLQLPSADPTRHQQFYDLSPRSRFGNLMVRCVLEEIIRHWPADRPLRVLEIGAGTGGLTAAVLPVLPADRTRYTFTDVSAAVLGSAEHRFSAYDFVDYRTFGLDTGTDGKELAEAGFDVVLAAGALHTAADLTEGLRRVRRLLAPGGRLLAVESHDLARLAAVFGSLDGFWRRSDHALRPDGLLLRRDQWPPLLERCGFTDVVRTGPDTDAGAADLSVLVAGVDDHTAPPPPALAAPAPGTVWRVGAEAPSEEPLAQALAELLGGATVTDLEGLSGPAEPGAEEVATVLVLGEPEEHPDRIVGQSTRRAAALRALAASSARLQGGTRASVWLVTRPSGLLPAPERPAHPGDAPVWGAARTLANEWPDLTVRRISLDRCDDPSADARRLAQELLSPCDEDEIVLTRGGRFVARETGRPAHEPAATAQAVLAPAVTAPACSFALTVRDPGLSYRLLWQERPAPRPGPGQIVIEVKAAALNYRDTMRANGLLPAEAVEGTPTEHGLGMECAGVVTDIGPGTTTWAPGDRVFGLAAAALASHAVADAGAVGRVPDGMSFTEAATLPVVFATVHYSLAQLARLAPGETLLVHGGAGGVGLAALQYAGRHGAHVIATAGSDAKRDLLAALGVEHVLDSRSLDFVPRVRELTGGRGVHVVVNSLSGEAGDRSLELLRPGGRFIELGKRDMFENRPLPRRPFLDHIAYFGVDITRPLADPDAAKELLREIVGLVHAEDYRPLPHVVHPAARVEEAFRLLQHSHHTGKVVVAFDPLDEPVPVRHTPVPAALDPDGTYLVTGGLGGFGAATADWLADQGARHLALVGRRGAEAPEAAAVVDRLTRRGITATPYAADVTDEAAVRRVFAAVDATGHPLRGVVHGAMHLDDAPLSDLTDDRFAAVLAPKAAGAAVLHRLTADRDLDLFLLHSSVTACVGNVYQAPYVAGNSYLEALARARRHADRPGTAIAWGAIDGTGYVARNDLGDAVSALGIDPVAPDVLLPAAAGVLAEGAAVAAIGRFRWSRARHLLPAMAAPRFTHLVPARSDASADTPGDVLRALSALPPDEAAHAITGILAGFLATVLRTEVAELTPDRPLAEFGIDSLMGAEFLVRAREYFDVRLSPAELLGNSGNLTQLARLIRQRLEQAVPAPRTTTETPEQGGRPTAGLTTSATA
ncbi:SDR family NAD(P)-dependent oxidoreductase [Streptomyces sp. KM273126]|uniref:type I polyketide synthase n=1 Tax=Streptomyces sp. KM273126 TaxID=2545247 RepID=UPI00103F45FF|nr:type I polyketide synthase [Streptomyces sp. KM273126]MBA2811145.1 SDR family NAD(P)-dependent oxidoreductase [Streptomyces sp. KM273126]